MPSFMSISTWGQELFPKNRGGRDKPPGGYGLTFAPAGVCVFEHPPAVFRG